MFTIPLESPSAALKGHARCFCFIEVVFKTCESLGAHIVVSRGILSFKRDLRVPGPDWEMGR